MFEKKTVWTKTIQQKNEQMNKLKTKTTKTKNAWKTKHTA